MEKAKHASVEVAVGWASRHASHRERYFFGKVDFWRDLFPGRLGEHLGQAQVGERVAEDFLPGEVLPEYAECHVHVIARDRLRGRKRNGAMLEPQVGRFYPRGLIAGVEDTFPEDRRPFRYLGPDGTGLRVDLNHPLARYGLSVEARVVENLPAREEHGGRCNDLVQDAVEAGPGLQASLTEIDTDFFSGRPFDRQDETDDEVFYQQPRLVHHVDASAREQITALYGRLLPSRPRVLDLMSSWESHLPRELDSLTVSGLGMNREELEQNARLADFVVQNLNKSPLLPYPENAFDAVVCTVSVEYLTQPIEVFREVGRVLRPDGVFIVTFSDRWFPPKAIRLWSELHPFERVGLVIDYFRRSGCFGRLRTESVRGLPRPPDDKYAHMMSSADPVYAVWGTAQER